MSTATAESDVRRSGNSNSVQRDDLPVHGWYRFVLSYPPHLVRQYLNAFGLEAEDTVLDPFCGTGTTLVEAKKQRVASVGYDAHPFASMVSRVKTHWRLDATGLRAALGRILRQAERLAHAHGLPPEGLEGFWRQEPETPPVDGFQLSEDEEKLLPTGFLSQRPLARLLILRGEIERACADEARETFEFFLVALSHVISNGAGNFAFGPEIYRIKPKPDYDVLGHFARHGHRMIQELAAAQAQGLTAVPVRVIAGDARELPDAPGDLAGVITSPPYPNEKDYTRTTRVESILLRLITDRASLRQVKEGLLRSNTRNVFVGDDDGEEVREFASIRKVCDAIEMRRVELEKNSGFERLYHKVVAHYFGRMRRHLRALFPKLRRGARLAYVVGDQLSFLMVPVATAQLLAEVATAEGYRTIGCDLWRERIGTRVRNSSTYEKTVRVREEILLLQKPQDS